MRLIDLDVRRGIVWLSYPYDVEITAIVKSLPERNFDSPSRRWWVPLVHVAIVLQRLEPLHFKFTPRMRAWWREHGDSVTVDPVERDSVDPEDGYTVARLNAEARSVLAAHFDAVWLVAEVDGYARNKADGHAYFELVDRIGGDSVARVRAVMFASTRQRIVAALRPDIDFRDGLRVRVQGRVDLYATTGSFQFIVEEIDVNWAIGARRRKRDEVVEKLREEGIATANLNLPLAFLPLRIGLITAAGSDAYNDFVHELERSRLGFEVVFAAAQVQGHGAEPSLLRALDALSTQRLDAIVITRGGGARGDLAAFDSLEVARRVCTLGVKVIVGIGHHRDQSVLDFVATSEKTPTAAAQLLVQRAVAARDQVDRLTRALIAAADLRTTRLTTTIERHAQRAARHATEVLHDAQRRADVAAQRAAAATQRRVEQAHQRTGHAAQRLERSASARLERGRRKIDHASLTLATAAAAQQQRAQTALINASTALQRVALGATVPFTTRINLLDATVRMAHPARVLERGYALLRDGNGRIITTAAALTQLPVATVELADGAVHVHPVRDE